MIETMLTISLILFGVSIAITVIRLFLGPSFSDRVIAMDVVGVNLISAIAIVSLLFNTKAFLQQYETVDQDVEIAPLEFVEYAISEDNFTIASDNPDVLEVLGDKVNSVGKTKGNMLMKRDLLVSRQSAGLGGQGPK